MTLVDPSAGSRGRSTTSAAGHTTRRGIDTVWAIAWGAGVPVLVAVLVNQLVGTAWGVIPPGLPVAGTVALVGAVVVCAGMRSIRADVLLGAVPLSCVLVAGVAGQRAWLGLVAGLVAGGIAFAVRRKRR